MRRALHASVLLLGLGLFVAAVASCDREPDKAAALEERLLAPCCWRQSLRVHQSPVATELRAEIGRRLAAGEPPAQVERELIERYGEEMRALPRGHDPRWMLGGIAALAVAAGMVVVVQVGRRFRRAVPPETARPLAPEESDRLDDELAQLD